jgi:hypothetical protein
MTLKFNEGKESIFLNGVTYYVSGYELLGDINLSNKSEIESFFESRLSDGIINYVQIGTRSMRISDHGCMIKFRSKYNDNLSLFYSYTEKKAFFFLKIEPSRYINHLSAATSMTTLIRIKTEDVFLLLEEEQAINILFYMDKLS